MHKKHNQDSTVACILPEWNNYFLFSERRKKGDLELTGDSVTTETAGKLKVSLKYLLIKVSLGGLY